VLLLVQRLISPETNSQVFTGRILHASETLQLPTFVVACKQILAHYLFIYYKHQTILHFILIQPYSID